MKKTILYDVDLKRPGCVILQAAFGATVKVTEDLFPSRTWLTEPAPGLRVYGVTDEELKKLSKITIAHHKKTSAKPVR